MENMIRDLLFMLYEKRHGVSLDELSEMTGETPIRVLCGLTAIRMNGLPVITVRGRFILPDPETLTRWSRDNPRLSNTLTRFWGMAADGQENSLQTTGI